MSYNINAYAKINLSLHVTGQNNDQTHNVDSIITFADICDTINISLSQKMKVKVDGKYARHINNKNLVTKTAEIIKQKYQVEHNAEINLTKNLPVAAGIGGGSADAAATINALNEIWKLRLNKKQIRSLADEIGADVQVCIKSKTAHVRGTGNVVKEINAPTFGIILINPNKKLSTKNVFQNLRNKKNTKMSMPPKSKNQKEWIQFLKNCRNDLQDTATIQIPEINKCISTLKNTNPLLVRMSGSGPTCFALYQNAKIAENIAKNVNSRYWVRYGKTK